MLVVIKAYIHRFLAHQALILNWHASSDKGEFDCFLYGIMEPKSLTDFMYLPDKYLKERKASFANN